MFKTKQTN